MNKKLKTSKVIIDFLRAQESFPYMRYMQFSIQSHTFRNYFKTWIINWRTLRDALLISLNQGLSYIVLAVLLFAAAVLV